MWSPRQRDGFILIVVLWITAFFALVAAAFIRSAQVHVRATAASIQSTRAEFLADSGLSLAALDLIEQRLNRDQSRRRFPVNGTAVRCSLGLQGRLSIALQDAGGRVNLNTAGEQLLQALFVGLGASNAKASSLADAIIDFRDQDDQARPAGAEKSEYAAAGRPSGPKNAALESLDELHQILGFDAAMIAAMTPHVTIYSGTAGLDPEVTTPELTELLSRGAQGLAGLAESGTRGRELPTDFIVSSAQRVFLAHITAQTASEATYVREAIIELPQNLEGFPIYKVWKRGVDPAGFDGDGGNALPPC